MPTSWTEALERAAEGLREARDTGGVGVLPGGRLTVEDAYAYAKFARVALGTNDIDSRARAHSAEELDFLAARVVGLGPETGAVTYGELETAPAVLLVGFEPEEESPIVFLRLRKAARKPALSRCTRWPPLARRRRCWTVPGDEPAAAGAAPGRRRPRCGAAGAAAGAAVAGSMAARRRGSWSASGWPRCPARCQRGRPAGAATTGARLAWVPRRAGERGAVEVGAVPTLLPGGRLVGDAGARDEVERVWGGPCPDDARPGRGRDRGRGRRRGAVGAAGRRRRARRPARPGAGPAALGRVGFVVSLEIRQSR